MQRSKFHIRLKLRKWSRIWSGWIQGLYRTRTNSPFQKGANPQTPDRILYKMYINRGDVDYKIILQLCDDSIFYALTAEQLPDWGKNTNRYLICKIIL